MTYNSMKIFYVRFNLQDYKMVLCYVMMVATQTSYVECTYDFGRKQVNRV